MSVVGHRLRSPVLVVGAYGYGNVGDEAILSGLLARLAGHSVTVVSRSPGDTSALHGVPSIGIDQAVFALRRHRSVVIGGGGLFGRDMGRIGRLLPAFGLMSAALGRKVSVVGIDLDDRTSGSARVLLPALMRAAASVQVRDRASAAVLARWGIGAGLEPDLSAWMVPRSAEAGRQALERAGLDPERPMVGLALTAVDPALADRVIEATTAAIDALPDAQFCFIPMSRHPWVPSHDDRLVAQRLRLLRPRVALLDDPMPPDLMLAAIGELSALVAMRYHAMLFASRAGVPLIPISYADKTERWVAEHELRSVRPEARAMTRALREALDTGASGRREPLLRTAS
jgi:polysaccharide pyruvyl transferase WcaK-like protein